jgi:hypothetical protein
MSTRNLLGGKGKPARGDDNLTAICEPILWKLWEPRYLTTLWAFTACYGRALPFTLYIFLFYPVYATCPTHLILLEDQGIRRLFYLLFCVAVRRGSYRVRQ